MEMEINNTLFILRYVVFISGHRDRNQRTLLK